MTNEFGGDVGLQIGERQHQIGIERENLWHIRGDEGRHPRLLAPHPRRPHRIARHAGDAVFLAEEIERLHGLLGQADDAFGKSHITYSLHLNSSRRPLVLPVGATYNGHELFDLPALVSLVTGVDRVLDTMRHVVTKDFFFKSPQGGTHSSNLRYDINAISVPSTILASPRTCPSMRVRRFPHEALMLFLMPLIYPYRVWVTILLF